MFYTDQELDGSTGLYNYDARLYDPVIGRFLSADSVVPDQFNPQSLNRYSYVLNNPLLYTDPTGHWFRDPDTGENVASDPSSYDVDYNGKYGNPGSYGGTHVDWSDGDDTGEAGWAYHDDSDRWVNHNLDAGKKAAKVLGEAYLTAIPVTQIEKIKWFFRSLNWWSKTSENGSPATGWTGRRGFQLNQPEYQPKRNPDSTIGGRRYGGHALDDMQNRGLTPSVVDDAIQNGIQSPDPIPGRVRNYSPGNNITVITEGTDVVSVIPGRR